MPPHHFIIETITGRDAGARSLPEAGNARRLDPWADLLTCHVQRHVQRRLGAPKAA